MVILQFINRAIRNLITTRFSASRAFSLACREDIANKISQSELKHSGEIRFAVESSLSVMELCRGMNSRSKALELFKALGIDQTVKKNGVLIYLLLAERRIEIIADVGIEQVIESDFWSSEINKLSKALKKGEYKEGVIQIIDDLTELLSQHFAPDKTDLNELKNDVYLV